MPSVLGGVCNKEDPLTLNQQRLDRNTFDLVGVEKFKGKRSYNYKYKGNRSRLKLLQAQF